MKRLEQQLQEKKMKHLKTPKQLNEASENLNISDVSDSYYVFFLNSENQWVQSTREVFKNIDDAMDYIGDKKRLKVFKIVQ